MNQAEPQRLAAVDGRVWFLGYGLGGCAGLALLVGALSLAVDKSVWPGLCALALSGLHAGALIYFWLRMPGYTRGIADKRFGTENSGT